MATEFFQAALAAARAAFDDTNILLVNLERLRIRSLKKPERSLKLQQRCLKAFQADWLGSPNQYRRHLLDNNVELAKIPLSVIYSELYETKEPAKRALADKMMYLFFCWIITDKTVLQHYKKVFGSAVVTKTQSSSSSSSGDDGSNSSSGSGSSDDSSSEEQQPGFLSFVMERARMGIDATIEELRNPPPKNQPPEGVKLLDAAKQRREAEIKNLEIAAEATKKVKASDFKRALAAATNTSFSDDEESD